MEKTMALIPKLTLMNPVLAVNNIENNIAYFKDILGFEVTWIWGEPTKLGFDILLKT